MNGVARILSASEWGEMALSSNKWCALDLLPTVPIIFLCPTVVFILKPPSPDGKHATTAH